MAKILKNNREIEHTCEKCGSIVAFTFADLGSDGGKQTVTCPVCFSTILWETILKKTAKTLLFG
jgi:DNA-directed RNA polymerase subunit RPC12/RpoP